MADTPYTAYSYLEGGLMAVINAFAEDAADRAEPLTVAAAYAQCRDAAPTPRSDSGGKPRGGFQLKLTCPKAYPASAARASSSL
jgi:hypothetical protein